MVVDAWPFNGCGDLWTLPPKTWLQSYPAIHAKHRQFGHESAIGPVAHIALQVGKHEVACSVVAANGGGKILAAQ